MILYCKFPYVLTSAVRWHKAIFKHLAGCMAVLCAGFRTGFGFIRVTDLFNFKNHAPLVVTVQFPARFSIVVAHCKKHNIAYSNTTLPEIQNRGTSGSKKDMCRPKTLKNQQQTFTVYLKIDQWFLTLNWFYIPMYHKISFKMCEK